MNKKLLLSCFLLGILLASPAHAIKTILILNDLFVDFSVTSDYPYWINDSQIVHNMGRVDYLSDGRYILTNARTYYAILNSAHGEKLARVWAEKTNGDFDNDVIEHYNNREQINFSYDLDLQKYWKGRKEKVFGDKK